MEWHTTWDDPFTTYLTQFDSLIGDARTRTTLTETVKGIIAAGSLVCQRIAAQSPILAAVKDGPQRVLRLATGESTKRSPHLDADHLTAKLRKRAVAQLSSVPADELWLIADGSDLRKPHAHAMPHLMRVKGLDGSLVNGYRTLNVIGLTPQRRGILYHRLFSSQAPGFVSEPHEVQQALTTVSQAIAPLKVELPVTWIVDREFDDVAVWRTIWEQDEHVVCRVKHTERLIDYQDQQGVWHAGDIAAARRQLRYLGKAETMMVVQRGRQKRPKEQQVPVELWGCPLRLGYDANVRRPGERAATEQLLWLVEVRLLDTTLEPWLLVTDWPVADEASALRIFRMYRQRWAVEDSFKFTKECLGWEAVQVLDLRGVRTLVALAWVAAGFLYELGVTLEWAEVWVLARLGGWVPHKDRLPGKITLTRGLRRLLELRATEAILQAYVAEHGQLPPKIDALLGGWHPPGEL
ncbi:MAG: transposase [Chloroflexota bacterium]|nr:transposase [Chloroflexota bacterium]